METSGHKHLVMHRAGGYLRGCLICVCIDSDALVDEVDVERKNVIVGMIDGNNS